MTTFGKTAWSNELEAWQDVGRSRLLREHAGRRSGSLAGCGKRGRVATQALSSFSILCSGKTVTGIVLGPTN
jgi:hypothetical protein